MCVAVLTSCQCEQKWMGFDCRFNVGDVVDELGFKVGLSSVSSRDFQQQKIWAWFKKNIFRICVGIQRKTLCKFWQSFALNVDVSR
jgi:hypothetical protein